MWYTGNGNRLYCYPNKEFDIMGCKDRKTSCKKTVKNWKWSTNKPVHVLCVITKLFCCFLVLNRTHQKVINYNYLVKLRICFIFYFDQLQRLQTTNLDYKSWVVSIIFDITVNDSNHLIIISGSLKNICEP